jgi:hypothetical protein
MTKGVREMIEGSPLDSGYRFGLDAPDVSSIVRQQKEQPGSLVRERILKLAWYKIYDAGIRGIISVVLCFEPKDLRIQRIGEWREY